MNEFDNTNSLVIIGEAHLVKGTYETEAYIIERLIKRGKSCIIIESGISEALILNEYLKTGDTILLKNTRASGESYRLFIQKLRSISKTNEMIYFKGVDFERPICLEFLFNSWFNQVRNAKLEKFIKDLKKINKETSPKKLKKVLLNLRTNYNLYEDELNIELGSNAKHLHEIIFNPVFMSDYGFSSKKRDKAILKNLLSIKKDELKKSIIIFGSNHFTYDNFFWTTFGTNLKGNMECILFLMAYKNCTNLMKEGKYNSGMPLVKYVSKDSIENSRIYFEPVIDKNISLAEKNNKFIIVKLISQ
jgi:mRNA-degrading endonuclease YafQ of YafQ-DinJ toxin-antitoxin module